jgi:hypothetical protein
MKKLLAIFSSISFIVTPMTSVISCQKELDYKKIRLTTSEGISTLFSRLIEMVPVNNKLLDPIDMGAKDLLPKEPKEKENWLKSAITRVFETNALRIEVEDFDNELNLTLYDQDKKEINFETLDLTIPFCLKLASKSNSKYFDGETAIIKVDDCEAFDANDQVERTCFVDEFNSWKYKDLTLIDNLSYSIDVKPETICDKLYSLNTSSLVAPIFLNSYQLSYEQKIEEPNEEHQNKIGVLTLTPRDTSDRYYKIDEKSSVEVRYNIS